MTTQEVAAMVAEVGIPTAYYQFTNETAKAPPFLCFYYPSDNDFKADDLNYVRINRLIIELYTDEKDFALEHRVEEVLSNHGLVYTRSEDHLDDEKLYMVVYETEVIITEQRGKDNGEQD